MRTSQTKNNSSNTNFENAVRTCAHFDDFFSFHEGVADYPENVAYSRKHVYDFFEIYVMVNGFLLFLKISLDVPNISENFEKWHHFVLGRAHFFLGRDFNK